MSTLFSGLNLIAGLASLVCFIMVLIAMFKSGDTTMAIVCLVLTLCGLGPLIAFIMGWINAAKWNVQKIMPIWTVAFIAGIAFGVLSFMTAPAGPAMPAIGG